MKPTQIYALLDPFTSEVRYVGKSVDVKRRWYGHCHDNYRNQTYSANWIRSLKPHRPHFIILETVEHFSDWIEAEMFWIAYLRSLGANLTNLTLGGEGLNGFTPSKETIAKIRLKTIGQKRNAEICKRMSDSAKKKPPVTEITREKRRISALNASEEVKNKRKYGFKNKRHTEESRAKMAIAATGRPATPGAIERCYEMAKNSIGRKDSPETLAKKSAWQKGKKTKPQSPETVAKRAAIMKEFWNTPEGKEKKAASFIKRKETLLKQKEAKLKQKEELLLAEFPIEHISIDDVDLY